MANSRHGKFVSVTDWFAPPPGSTEQNNVVKIGAPSGGASFSGGGSWGSGNSSGGGSSVTIIKTNDTTPESNSNVYSALRVKNNFIAKNKNERTSGKLSSDIGFEVGEFVSGTSGALLYVDPDTLETTAELDRLYVRVKAYFEELEIVNVNSIGGKQLITPAGSVKCYGVATYDEDTTIPEGVYRCYFLAEQDGVKIENRFEINDQIYCQEFNASAGSSQQVSNRFYWRLCTGVSTETVSYNDKQCHYIDLSMSDAATDSDAPKADDILCHRGNRTDSSRQGVLEFSAVDTFSPSITLYQEVGKSNSNAGYYPYNLTNRDVVSYGVNQTTGAAFMNVYGNMYIGNRDESSFLSFDTKKGLSLKGSLRMGSTLEGKDGNELTLEERFEQVTQAYKEDINQFKAAIDKALGGLQSQLDGNIETYFLDPVPTLDNYPANTWTTNEIKAAHIGDLYYNADGYAYRFQYEKIENEDGSSTERYYWNQITDTDIILALMNAKKAQDTADSKRKVFIQQPSTNDNYDVGDLWSNATYMDPTTGQLQYDNDLLRAVISKTEGELFSIEHWELASKYTDDTAAIEAKMLATEALAAANKAQSTADSASNLLEIWSQDGYITPSERQGIKEELQRCISDNKNVEKQWEQFSLNQNPTQEDTDIYNQYDAAYLTYGNDLLTIIGSTEVSIPIPTDFDTHQTEYYENREVILYRIAEAAKAISDEASAKADLAKKDAEAAIESINKAQTSIDTLGDTVTGIQNFTDDAFKDNVISESERSTITGYSQQINTVWEDVAKSYESIKNNILLEATQDKVLEDLNATYITLESAKNELLTQIDGISTGVIEQFKLANFLSDYNNFKGAYSSYQQYLNQAVRRIEEIINNKADNLGGELSRFSNAFTEQTTSVGGLLLTSVLSLGYTNDTGDRVTTAGLSGLGQTSSDIVIWAGGDAIDATINTNAENAAKFLVRADGTGYAAGGNFWWNAAGEIHADPLSFVVGEDSVSALLKSFHVTYRLDEDWNILVDTITPKAPFLDVRFSGITSFDTNAKLVFGTPDQHGVMQGAYLAYDEKSNSVYFARTDGNPANLMITGGVTMYGLGDTKPATIMDAIKANLDPNTLTIDSTGRLTVIGGATSEGVDEGAVKQIIESYGYITNKDIPTSLKSPYSLIFGNKTYDGSSSKEITASDLGAITSHQVIYSLTIKNSAGTTQLTYSPNSTASSLTLTKAMVGLGNVENTALSTWAGSSKINTLGTITTGIWNGTKITNNYIANPSISIAGIDVALGESISTTTLKSNLGLGSLAYKSSLIATDIPLIDWSKISTGKPTTLSGYGIADAKISSGIITLGANSITPLTSHQTIYNLTMQAGIFSATTFDPNGAAKTVNIPTSTSHISEGTNLYYTDARARTAITGGASTVTSNNLTASRALISNSSGKIAVSAVTSTELGYLDGVTSAIQTQLNNRVDLTSTQSINGVKDFTGGIKINGSKLAFNSTDNILTVNGNLLVTGGITMYSQKSQKNIIDRECIPLSKLSKIELARFKWKDNRDDNMHIGGIADEIKNIIPEVIYETQDNKLSMDYGNAAFAIASSLIKPVIDHEERIKALERENEMLKQELNRLRA